MSIKDGANYAPQGQFKPVVEPGEFNFAAAFLDHGHINGQTNGLIAAGATLTAVYDPIPARAQAFVERYPQAQVVARFEYVGLGHRFFAARKRIKNQMSEKRIAHFILTIYFLDALPIRQEQLRRRCGAPQI